MRRAELRWPRPDGPGIAAFHLPANGRSLLLGRSPDLTLSLPDSRVSWEHAKLSCTDGVWFIDDADSRSGTYLAREERRWRVSRPERLRHGDRVRLGRTILTFHSPPLLPEPVKTTLDTAIPVIDLTDRERDVLRALCAERLGGRAGWPSNGELAAGLFLAEDTVRTHLKSLYRKFDLNNVDESQRRVHLIDRAVDEGYVVAGR